MKTVKNFIVMALVGFFVTACQSDEDQSYAVDTQGKTAVNFELNANAIKYDVVNNAGLKYSPEYSEDGFRIYAFRRIENGADYKFEKTINLTNMEYDPDKQKLIGSDLLNIGTYKFLSVYGVNQGVLTTTPFNASTVLTDNFAMAYNGTAALNEIFVEDGPASTLKSYSLGLTSDANETVTATLKRAVSRVDIMFIKAKKEGEVYTELPYTNGNAFGQKDIETLQLRYKDLNSSMNFFGSLLLGVLSDTTRINLSNFTNIVTFGTAQATSVGQEDYARYDNVQESDLITGAAHVFGNYLIPNAENEKKVGLRIYIKPVGGEGRIITLADKLPIERNKVTLVKIYVIDNGDTPGPEEPNVFTTKVNFEVEIETVWDGSNEVIGEVK